MKKKLALLMALIMVIGLMPMGVFGATVPTVRPGQLHNQRAVPSNQVGTFNFTVDTSGLADLDAGIRGNVVLRFRFSGGNNAGAVGFASDASIVFSPGAGYAQLSGPPNFVQRLNDAIDYQDNREVYPEQAASGRVRGIDIDLSSVTSSALEGMLNLAVHSVMHDHADAHLVISVHTGGGVLAPTSWTLFDGSLVAGWGNGVTIDTVSVVPVGQVAHLSGVTITENAIGRLNQDGNVVNVRLIAPRGFRWEFGTLPGVIGSGVNATFNSAFVTNGGGTGNIQTAFNENTLRDELFVDVTLPARAPGFAAETTMGRITLRGMTLIPTQGAATSGNVAVDVYVGGSGWGSGTRTGTTWSHPGLAGHLGGANWRRAGLVVASLDEDGEISVTGHEEPAELVSGAFTTSGNGIHGNSASLTISETVPGTMFRALDRFELRAPEGVNITSVHIRGRNAAPSAGNLPLFAAAAPSGAGDAPPPMNGWVDLEANTGNNFLAAFTEFANGNVTFGPRTLDPDPQSRIRYLEVRLQVSVEAGFAATHGSDLVIDVLRNGVTVGSATIATVTDPIVVTSVEPNVITRHAFDMLGLTPVAGFTVEETAAGNLEVGDQLWFHIEGTQDGVPVSFDQFNMRLHLGNLEINEAESDMWLRPIPSDAAHNYAGEPLNSPPSNIPSRVGFEVVRPSYEVPGVLSFNNVYVSGAAIPGIQWHVVVSGPQVSANNADWMIAAPPTDTSANAIATRRTRFFGMPYHATVLSVDGTPVIEEVPAPGDYFEGIATVPVTFSPATVSHGAPAIIIRDGATLIQARAFTDSFSGEISHNAGVVTATGINRRTGEQTTVVMQIGAPTVIIDGGAPVDISAIVGQPTMVGRIVPVLEQGRTYVPVRFLAEVFGIPFSRTSGGGIRFN